VTNLGVCITNREFTCLLCDGKFIRETADIILLEYTICDACYAELLILEEPALSRRVSEKLKGKPHRDDTVLKAVVKVIQAKKAGT
jgi:hypothetical protein